MSNIAFVEVIFNCGLLLLILLDDSVYMENDDYRNEYVMNEKGRIWTGRQNGRPWDFGQVVIIWMFIYIYIYDSQQG